MKRVAFIVNPISGKGRGPEAAEEARRFLQGSGLEVVVHQTRFAGDGLTATATLAPDCDAVVAVGGDGTLSEVIRGTSGHPSLVGLIPIGTANVVARDLHIPLRVGGAARALLAGTPRELDVGEVNGRLFLAMVGVGFDGEVVKRIAERRKGPISMASYLKPAMGAIREHRAIPMRVAVDGTELPDPCYGLIVSNTRNYGGVLSVTPRADWSDGWLDYQFHRSPRIGALVRCGVAAVLRRPASSKVAHYGRGRQFTVTAESPVAVQVDGDSFGATPVSITLHPRAVRVIVPPNGKHP